MFEMPIKIKKTHHDHGQYEFRLLFNESILHSIFGPQNHRSNTHRSGSECKAYFGYQSKFLQHMLVWFLYNHKIQKRKKICRGDSHLQIQKKVFFPVSAPAKRESHTTILWSEIGPTTEYFSFCIFGWLWYQFNIIWRNLDWYPKSVLRPLPERCE